MHGESNTMNNNLHLMNSRPTWTNFLKRWISVSIRHSSHEGFISKVTKLFRQTVNIYSICFYMDNSYYFYSKHRNVLCGSLKMTPIETIYYTWVLRTPTYSCTNITIIELPTSDQLLQDKFQLTITYLQLDNDSFPQLHTVMLHSYEPVSIITNTSMSEVSLNITQVSKMSKLMIYFQAIECGLLVTKYMPEIYFNVPLQFNMPYAYFPINDITEYHVIVRTEIGTKVRISAECNVLNSVKLYDGPSLWSSTLAIPYYEGSDELCEITSTTFQMYIVNIISGQIYKIMSNIIYSAYKSLLSATEMIEFTYGFSLKWDFSNITGVYYKEYIVIPESLGFDDHISYYVDIEKTIGPQGYLCQYGGLYIKDIFEWNLPNDVGPICSNDYAELIRNMQFISSSTFILYTYGRSFSQKGTIYFSGIKPKCDGMINPCAICTSEYYAKWLIIRFMRIKIVPTCFKAKYIHIIFLGNGADEECILFLVIPSISSINHGTCKLFLFSSRLKQFQLQMNYKYSLCGPYYHNVISSSEHSCQKSKYNIILKGTSNYVSHFPRINFERFQYIPFLSIETQIRAHEICQDVSLTEITQDWKLSKYDYDGTCFKFKAILSTEKKQIKFSVHYSKEVDSLINYINRFLVLTWIDSVHINNTSGESLKMSITDTILMEDRPLQFHFTSQQLPLVWKSLGQVLEIEINAGEQLKENTLIYVTVMAIINVEFVFSFFINATTTSANIPCHVNATHVTSDSCWTVHKDFHGNWNSASEICRNQGGYLWSVNSDKEWNEVLTSPRYYNLQKTPDNQYLQPVNAMRYFRISSLIYLGLRSDGKVRT